MQPNLETFLERLRAAFPNTPIHSAGAFNEWGATYPDGAEYERHIDGRTWEQLDRGYVVRRSDALGFLSTSHLAAVLPAYLHDMSEHGVWSQAAGMLTLILAKPLGERDGLGPLRFDALVNALTTEQREVVASALHSLARRDADGSLGRAATEALERYWTTHLKGAE